MKNIIRNFIKCLLFLIIFVSIFPLSLTSQFKFDVVNPTYCYSNLPYFKHRLTTDYGNKKTAIWNEINNGNLKLNLNNDFTLEFYMNFGMNSDDIPSPRLPGADGIVFILQNEGNNVIGRDAGFLGYIMSRNTNGTYYGGIDNSVAIEFDTWHNPDELNGYNVETCYHDPLYDHLNIVFNGKPVYDSNTPQNYNDAPPIYLENNQNKDVEDGEDYCIKIDYNAETRICSVYVTPRFLPQSLRATVYLGTWITGTFGTNPPLVNWGFTSSTGNRSNEQTVQFIKLSRDGNNDFDVKVLTSDNQTINQSITQDCLYPIYYICNGGSIKLSAESGNSINYVKWSTDGGTTFTDQDNTSPYELDLIGPIDNSLDCICYVVFSNGCEVQKTFSINPSKFNIKFKSPQVGKNISLTDCSPWLLLSADIENQEDVNLNNYTNPNSNEFIDWQWTFTDGWERNSYNDWNKQIAFNTGKKTMTVQVSAIYTKQSPYYQCQSQATANIDFDYSITLGVIQELCKDGIGQITVSSFIPPPTVNPPETFTYLWRGPSFTGDNPMLDPTIDDNDFLNPSQKMLQSPSIKADGKYRVWITYGISGCLISEEINIIVNEYQVILFNPDKLCNDCPGKLQTIIIQKNDITGSWVNVPPSEISSIIWELNSNPIFLNPDVGTNDLFSINDEGTYYIKVIMTNDCEVSTILPVEKHEFLVTIDGAYFCNELEEISPVIELSSNTSGCNGNLTYFWEYLDETDQSLAFYPDVNVRILPIVQVKKSGRYKLTVTDEKGCTVITEFEVLDYEFKVETDPLIICNGLPKDYDPLDPNSAKLSISPNDPSKYTFYWSMDDESSATQFLDDITIPNPTVNIGTLPILINQNKNLKVVVTMKDKDCTDEAILEIIKDDFIFEAHNEYLVCLGEKVQLRTHANVSGNYFWSPSEGLDNPFTAEPFCQPDREMYYSCTFYPDNSSCEKSISNIHVMINEDHISTNDFIKKMYRNDNPIAELWNENQETELYGVEKTSDCGYMLWGRYRYSGCCAATNCFFLLDENGLPTNNPIPTKEYGFWPDNPEVWYGTMFISDVERIFQPIEFYGKIYNQTGYICWGATYVDNSDLQHFLLLELDNNLNVTNQYVFNVNNYWVHPSKIIELEYNKYIVIGRIIYSNDNSNIFVARIEKNINGNFENIWSYEYGYSDSRESILDAIIQNNEIHLTGYSTKYSNSAKAQTLFLSLGLNGTVSNACYYDVTNFDKDNWGTSILSNNNGFIIGGNTYCFNDGNQSNLHLFQINIYGNPISIPSGKRIGKIDNSLSLNSNQFIRNNKGNIGVFSITRSTSATQEESFNLLTINDDITSIFDQKDYISIFHTPNIEEQKSNAVKLLPSDFYGFSFAGRVNYDINSDLLDYRNNYKLMFSKIRYNNNLLCNTNSTLELIDYDLNYHDITSSFSNTKSSVTLNLYNDQIKNRSDNLMIEDACSQSIVQLCYCDGSKIQVDIQPVAEITDPNQCCYTIKFRLTSTYSNCSIDGVQIDGTSYNFSLAGLNASDWTLGGTICFGEGELSERKIITLKYYSGNNFECSTDIDIPKCKCDCNDYDFKWSKLDILVEPAESSPEGQCCYDVFIDNKNDCGFRDAGLIISFPKNMRSDDDGDKLFFNGNDDWTPVLDNENRTLTLSRGNKQINGKINIGKICVKQTEGSQKIKIKIDNELCTKEWTKDLNCEPVDCCPDINICQYWILDQGEHSGEKFINVSWNNDNNPCNIAFVKITYGDNILIYPFAAGGMSHQQVDRNNFDNIANVEFTDESGLVIFCEMPLIVSNCNCEPALFKCCWKYEISPEGEMIKKLSYKWVFNNDNNCDINRIKMFVGGQEINSLPFTKEFFQDFTEILLPGTLTMKVYNSAGNLVYHFMPFCQEPPNCDGIFGKIAEQSFEINNQSTGIKNELKIGKFYNIPNPLSDETIIYYEINDKVNVSIELYNSLGLKVAELFRDMSNNGLNHIVFNSNNLQSGTYFVRLNAENIVSVIPIIIIK